MRLSRVLSTACRFMVGPHETARRAKARALPESGDPSTLSEPFGVGKVRQRHLNLEVAVDFPRRQLIGAVTVTAIRGAGCSDACELVLDSSGFNVANTYVEGKAVPFRFGELKPALGTPLHVSVPGGPEDSEVKVRIEYATAAGEGCSALQWLPPAQTSGKKHPYLFSQCEAIHARSMVPCQDTCAAKVTYEATIAAPLELTVLMSAVRQGDATPLPSPPAGVSPENAPGCDSGKWAVTRFEQKIAVPSYLVAIVCGKLGSRRIGPRSHVWSEEELLDACEHEFKEHTEKFLAAGEELCGPYVWGVYDLLVLPPSFPYGGMENPCLTFVTPSLIAGDRSQVSVVAHEIAHSWSGNLVTNRSWEHFWLNEGLTVFTEIKLVEKVLGAEQSALSAQIRLNGLGGAIKQFGETHGFTSLVPDLSHGINPDDCFSVVPYAKGWACFDELQTKAGG
eukprot:Hpha_TRINITY_DN8969_c0_g1::TRINITY_DN8969_c0_g1_i2::g.80763::m.80763/K01254/LTA4H; leukotriene-A4 hydrolase